MFEMLFLKSYALFDLEFSSAKLVLVTCIVPFIIRKSLLFGVKMCMQIFDSFTFDSYHLADMEFWSINLCLHKVSL